MSQELKNFQRKLNRRIALLPTLLNDFDKVSECLTEQNLVMMIRP